MGFLSGPRDGRTGSAEDTRDESGGRGPGTHETSSAVTGRLPGRDADGGDPVIEGVGLRHEYPDETIGLDGVDLTLYAGERVAVVGPNGSGKSTLQMVLGGLLTPTAGEVTYFGSTTDPEAVRDRLGVLLQDPDDYLFNTTVREDVEYGPAQLGVPRAEAERRIAKLVDELGIDGLLDRPPFRLSGGEKQRAALASVLSFDPDVLLLDEPTSTVDGAGRERVLELLDAQHEGGKTVVTFTPNLELVPRIADRVVVIGPSGTVAADGSVRDVLTDAPLLTANNLVPPAVTRLFEGFVDNPPLTVQEARDRLADRME